MTQSQSLSTEAKGRPPPPLCLRPKVPGSEGSILNMYSGFLSHCQVGCCKVNLPRDEHLGGIHLQKGEVNPQTEGQLHNLRCASPSLPPLLSMATSSQPWNPMQFMTAPLSVLPCSLLYLPTDSWLLNVSTGNTQAPFQP